MSDLMTPDIDDGSSKRRKIAVEDNEAGTAAGLPTTLFAKASHDLAQRLVLGLAGAAEAEVSFSRSAVCGTATSRTCWRRL